MEDDPPPPQSHGEQQQQRSVYQLKQLDYLGTPVTVVLQQENGPCSLIAIANALLLTRRMRLPTSTIDANEISSQLLLQLVAAYLSDVANPTSTDAQFALHEAIETLPLLEKGLDLNVGFSDVNAFEFDRTTSMLDLAKVPLYHAWVVDPQDEHFGFVRGLHFNGLVNKIVQRDEALASGGGGAVSATDARIVEGELASEFLSVHASQMTFYGLTRMHEVCREKEVSVFFRNNHFSTMTKHNGSVYLLCTDSAFKDRAAIGWERLCDIDGNTELVSPSFGDPNAYFIDVAGVGALDPSTTASGGQGGKSNSSDYALAYQMQLEENQRARSLPPRLPHASQSQAPAPSAVVPSQPRPEMSDYDMAVMLQRQEFERGESGNSRNAEPPIVWGNNQGQATTVSSSSNGGAANRQARASGGGCHLM